MSEDLHQLKGKPVNPLNLISYQEGSVVSRMITYTPQGTITLFAFASGSGLSEHTAPFDAILQILEGRMEVTLAGETFDIPAGNLIILRQISPMQYMQRFHVR